MGRVPQQLNSCNPASVLENYNRIIINEGIATKLKLDYRNSIIDLVIIFSNISTLFDHHVTNKTHLTTTIFHILYELWKHQWNNGKNPIPKLKYKFADWTKFSTIITNSLKTSQINSYEDISTIICKAMLKTIPITSQKKLHKIYNSLWDKKCQIALIIKNPWRYESPT